MANLTKSAGSILFVVWSFFLALGWLLPNHHLPWTSFHSEIWVAIILSLIVPFSILRAPTRFFCDRFFILVSALAILPLLQFAFGQISFFGHAWICVIYLVGLSVAILTGRFWESCEPARLIDMLSFAFGIGALFSVYLQLCQWFGLEGFGIWLMDSGSTRPSANFGQPNQLATLLLWGALAIFWGWVRAKVSMAVAVIMALFVIFGIALTGSRTAWLAIVIMVMAIWWWRKLWGSRQTPWVITGLGIYFIFCVLVLNFFGVSDRVVQLAALSADARVSAWKLLIGAVSERPIFGYGWGQVAEAQISTSLAHPALHIVFAQSHNMFLDLILWCGLPVGMFFSFILLRWFWHTFQRVNSPENIILFLFLLVVANHSMLEFPLQYAYFLLPTGLIIGTIIARDHKSKPLVVIKKNNFLAIWFLSVIMLSFTLSDYLKVEHSYRLLRLEWIGINLEIDPQPPKVNVLSQWHHIFKHARAIPRDGMSESELERMRQVVMEAHKPLDFRKLMMALELNGRAEEAALWLDRMCSVGSEQNCTLAKAELVALKSEIIPKE